MSNKYNYIIATLVTIALLVAVFTFFAHINHSATSPIIQPVTISGTTTGAVGGVGTSTTSGDVEWEQGMTVVTTQSNSQTIFLNQRERFVIQLGSTLKWSLVFSPTGSITRVPNSTTANGVQGIYEAMQPGTTMLHATGAPICKAGEMCPQFLQAVTVTFVIQ